MAKQAASDSFLDEADAFDRTYLPQATADTAVQAPPQEDAFLAETEGFDQFLSASDVKPQEPRRVGTLEDRELVQGRRLTTAVGEARTRYATEGRDNLEYVAEKIPFVGTGVTIYKAHQLTESLNRLRNPRRAEEPGDLERIADFAAEVEYLQKRGIGQKILDMIAEIPGFGVEFAVTRGVGTAARKGVQKVVGNVVKGAIKKKIASTVTGAVAQVTAHTLAQPHRIAAKAVERMTPEFGLSVDEQNELSLVIADASQDESLTEALGKGFVDHWIEVGSEYSGGLLTKIPGVSKLAAMKATIIRRYLLRGGTASGVRKLLAKSGFHGVLEESFEERVGEVARAGVGLAELPNYLSAEFAEQLGIELASFALYGGGSMAAAQTLDSMFMKQEGLDRGERTERAKQARAMGSMKLNEFMQPETAGMWAVTNPEAATDFGDLGDTPSRREWREHGFPQGIGAPGRRQFKAWVGEAMETFTTAGDEATGVEEGVERGVPGIRPEPEGVEAGIEAEEVQPPPVDEIPPAAEKPAVREPEGPAGVERQPWEMTEGEDRTANPFRQKRHSQIVAEAIARGEDVPINIIKSYPDVMFSESPWLMTKTEWEKYIRVGRDVGESIQGFRERLAEDALGKGFVVPAPEEEGIPVSHRAIIETAMIQGKPVPPEVLADYPDLAPEAPAAPETPSEPKAPIEPKTEPKAPEAVQKPSQPPVLEPKGKKAEGAKAKPKTRAGPGGTVPTSPLPSGEKAPSTGRVVSALSTAFGVPVRTGHFRGRARGIYKDLEEVARTKGYGDIAAAAHEVAHHVDKKANPLDGLPKALKQELAGLDYKPGRGDIHEGFAEYVRHRLTTDDAAAVAPQFDAWFNSWLDANPDMMDAFQAGRAAVDQWRGAGAVERVKAQIHTGESLWKRVTGAAKPTTLWDWIANNWINRLRPLLNVAKEMTGAGSVAELLGRMPGDINFWAFAKVSNISAAAKVRGWAEFGTSEASGEKVGPGLKETLGPIASDLQDSDTLLDFYAYTYSRHAITLYKQHDEALADWRKGGEVGPEPKLKNPGISRSDALATVSEFDSKKGWEKAAKGLTSWHNDLIDYLVDAGGLSEEAADAMKAMYPNYISLARHIDNDLAPTAGGGGSRFANLPQAVRRLKGSGRQILPPLESALAYAERIIGVADKIRVGKMLVEASKKYNTLGDTVEKVDPKDIAQSTRLRTIEQQLKDAGADLSGADMDALLTVFSQDFQADAKDNILIFYEKGKPQLYYVRPDLYRALMAVDKPTRLPEIIDQTFGRVARAIRLGTTGLKPGFSLLTNPLRDIQTAMLQTEYQPRNPFSISLNAAQGLVEELTGGEVAQLWARGGGPMAQPLGIDRKFLKETIQEILAQSPKAKALNWAQHPVDSLRSLFSLPEAAPRLAEFRAALYKMGWKPGQKITFEQYINAQLAAANVSVDFREGGSLGMWINQIVPFFNATIQGPHRMASAIRSHPVATISSTVLWLTIPALLLWWKYKDEEWYKDLTPGEKARYWHVMIPGTDIILRIPKPFEWGHIFASMPVGAAQSAYDEDPKAFTEAAGETFDDMLPSIVPGLAEAPVEIAANKDFYFDRPLVPQRLKDLAPKDQYAPYTTETAKGIGGLLGVSPIYVEHLAGGWTGGLATGAISAVESVAGLGGRKTQRALTGGPSTLPVVGRLFLSPLHTKQFDDFYNRLEKLEQKHASLKLRGKSDPSIVMLRFMQHKTREMAVLRKDTRKVLADDSLSDEKKREHFVRAHQEMLLIASTANKMSKLGGKRTSEDVRAQWEEIRKEEAGAIIFSALETEPKKTTYKGKNFQKAKKDWDAARELNKQRVLAVASSYEEAEKLLRDYYERTNKGKKGSIYNKATKAPYDLKPSYISRRKALKKLYGK